MYFKQNTKRLHVYTRVLEVLKKTTFRTVTSVASIQDVKSYFVGNTCFRTNSAYYVFANKRRRGFSKRLLNGENIIENIRPIIVRERCVYFYFSIAVGKLLFVRLLRIPRYAIIYFVRTHNSIIRLTVKQ